MASSCALFKGRIDPKPSHDQCMVSDRYRGGAFLGDLPPGSAPHARPASRNLPGKKSKLFSGAASQKADCRHPDPNQIIRLSQKLPLNVQASLECGC
jgi:hypothetical protein